MAVDQSAKSYGVDLAALATAVGQRLHDADMQVTPRQSEQFARALQMAPPASRSGLYHMARAIFVTDYDQIATFDRVFGEVFGSASRTVAATAAPERARAAAHA